MKYPLKVVLVVVACLAGFGLGYAIFPPLLARLMMLLNGEPMSNVELYNALRSSLLATLSGLIVGALCAGAFGVLVERLVNRHGLPGLVASEAAELETAKIEITLWGVALNEQGKPVRAKAFERKLAATVLYEFMHNKGAEGLVLKSGHGLSMKLARPRPSPYADEQAVPSGLVVTLIHRGKPQYTLETAGKGRYWRPEGKDVAFCRWALRYVGCEEEVNAALIFSGAPKPLSEVFLKDKKRES